MTTPTGTKNMKPDLTVTPKSFVGKSDKDTTNMQLQYLKTLRVGGKPIQGILDLLALMLRSTSITLPADTDDVDKRNAHWLKFMNTAKKVALEFKVSTSDAIFQTKTHPIDHATLSDADFLAALSIVFDRHMKVTASKQSGDPTKKRDYENIMAKIAELQERKRQMTAFDEPLTAREEAMLERAALKEQDQKVTFEPHYQNENAVCYLGLMYHTCKIVLQPGAKFGKMTVHDLCGAVRTIFQYLHYKCQESTEKLKAHIAASPECIYNGIDIKAGATRLINSAMWDGSSAWNRNLSNFKLNHKRLERMCAMITGWPSKWGVCINYDYQMLPILLQMHKFELELNQKVPEEKQDLTSESIIWYMILGKTQIINPLTDDQSQNAEGDIAKLLSRQGREERTRPFAKPYVDKDTFSQDELFQFNKK